METEGMSLEELKELKRTQYEEAKKSGVFQRLATVGRELGREVGRPGPKYLWEESGVRVFVDDYRGYVTAHANDNSWPPTTRALGFLSLANGRMSFWPAIRRRRRKPHFGSCKARDRKAALAV